MKTGSLCYKTGIKITQSMPATFAGQFRTVIRNNRLQKKSALLDSAL